VPSKDSARRLRDILGNIERIERYTAGMTLEGFVADTKTADAVERCLAEDRGLAGSESASGKRR
jgi:uncharacterized protein with HEPN domain